MATTAVRGRKRGLDGRAFRRLRAADWRRVYIDIRFLRRLGRLREEASFILQTQQCNNLHQNQITAIFIL